MPDAEGLDSGPRTRVGVIGVGHLGKHHARLLGQIPDAELVGIADTNADAAREVGERLGVRFVTDYRELLPDVQAVSIAAPTQAHREIAGVCLEAGRDVLVEKPITRTEAEGRELVALAAQNDCVLQVGHIERFNPALSAVDEMAIEPRYIEAHRLAPFTFRSTDIGVVLDLMIHDIDVILSLVDSPVASVEAFGGAVFTPAEDMASAILRFENGAVAHLTANRVALKPMRRMRMFSPVGYVSVDFGDAKGVIIRKNEGWDLTKFDVGSVDTTKVDDLWKFVFEGLLTIKEYSFSDINPLRDELQAFVTAVRDRSRPIVSGEDGCDALAVAYQVLSAIQAKPW